MAKNLVMEREIRQILRHEETRGTWRAIHKAWGKRSQNGISSIQIQQDSEWVDVTDQKEVESAIMSNNSKRFHLAATTPLMLPYLSSKLGFLANTDYTKSILNGLFVHDDKLDEYTNEFFNLIGKRPKLPPIQTSVSIHDFQNYWKNSRERTASSISKRHFGHYKAAATSNTLSGIHSMINHLSISTGTFLTRWTNGLTVMLEKLPGVTKVNKLRAILLMEADFNFLNKLIFGHRMIKQSEQYNRLPDELFGSRSGRSAWEVAVNRRLVIDSLRVLRRNGAIAGVDAAQCYDRIVHSMSSLLCQNEGTPLQPLLSMFGVIQCMTYYIRTMFGDSEKCYGGKQDIPFQGSCQGNGASPALWLVISMYLVLIMQEKNFASTVRTAYSNICLVFIGFLFVDDTDLVVIGNQSDIAIEVQTKLQSMVTFWNGILRVTGGALRPEKCYWYLLRFKWVDGISKLIYEKPNDILLSNDGGEQVAIDYKAPNVPTEAVGVWQDIDGSSGKQVEELLNKIRKVHNSLIESTLSRKLTCKGFKQALWPSISYVLPVASLNEKDGHRISTELYRPLLPKIGCNRNYPNLLKYNPPYLLGLNLYDPYIEHGIEKIKAFLTHGGSSSMTGKLIQSLLEQHQLEIGSITPLFLNDYEKYSFLTPTSWITEIWEFISKFNIHLQQSYLMGPSLQRVNDQAIMDYFIKQGNISKNHLCAINRVRCHMQIFTIADLATGNGKYVNSKYLIRLRENQNSQWKWHMESPTNADYKIWKEYILKLASPTGIQYNPLGKWLRRTHLHWKWVYSKQEHSLFHYKSNGWKRYVRNRHSRGRKQLFEIDQDVSDLPNDIMYASVDNEIADVVQLEGYAGPCIKELPTLKNKNTKISSYTTALRGFIDALLM